MKRQLGQMTTSAEKGKKGKLKTAGLKSWRKRNRRRSKGIPLQSRTLMGGRYTEERKKRDSVSE